MFFLSVLLLLMGGGSAWYVNHLYQDLSRALELNAASVRAAEELEIGLREVRSRLNEHIHDDVALENLDITGLLQGTEYWLGEAERLATTAHEQEIIARLKAGYSHFVDSMNELLKSQKDQNRRSRFRPLINEILTQEIIVPAHEYLDFNETTMLEVSREHKIFSKRIADGLMIISICGSIGGFGAGMLVARRMEKSLVELNLPLTFTAGKLSEIVGPIRISTGINLPELKRILDVIAVEVEKVVLRFQQTQADILESEKMAAIGQLAAGTAHELRNPLMSIKLLIQSALMRDELLDKNELLMMEQELDRVERTIQNLLEFARQPQMAIEPVTPERLVEQSLRLVQGRSHIQGVTMRTQVEAGLPLIYGDPSQLTQVLLNILMNALDATSQGDQIDITLSLEESPDLSGRKRLKFLVEDSGQGIHPDLLPRIFEPFISNKESGTGLGLSICKQIVEAHKGEIFASRRPTKGSAVGFYLPLLDLSKEHPEWRV